MGVSQSAGWYPDPSGEIQERFWDGAVWTRDTRPYPPPSSATAPQAASQSRDASRWLPLLKDPLAMKAAAYRDDSPGELLEAAYAQATRSITPGDPFPQIDPAQMQTFAGLARNPSTPQHLFAQLVGTGDPGSEYWRYCLAKDFASCPSMPDAVMRRLVAQESDDDAVRGSVAANPNVPRDLMEQLACDEEAYVRWCLAANPAVAHALLMRFVDEGDPEVLGVDVDGDGGGATNPQLASGTLESLANHAAPEVRAAVTWNPNTPTDLLLRLARDPEELVRCCVARNPQSSVDILRQLAEDPEEQVAIALSSNTSIPEDIVEVLHRRDMDILLASNPVTPTSMLQSFLADRHTSVITLSGLAGNPNLDEASLRNLAVHRDSLVRGGVGGNPSTPRELLDSLVKDADDSVRYSVLINPSYWP